MKLFVGLGNPGAKYAHNRHNIGFMAVDAIGERHSFGPWRKKFQGFAADGDIGDQKVLLLKPQTYMNDSGLSVGDAARFHKIGLNDISVFHDELDLAPSKIKVKIGGGDAGHNGLRSISQHLGSDYRRVRLGIGHPGAKELVTHHVLGDFAKADTAWLEAMLKAVADASSRLASGDDVRFLTDVARLLEPPKPKKTPADAAAKETKAGPPALKPDTAEAKAPRSALAEKLSKLLKSNPDNS